MECYIVLLAIKVPNASGGEHKGYSFKLCDAILSGRYYHHSAQICYCHLPQWVKMEAADSSEILIPIYPTEEWYTT
jgi:hypothetical protein